MAFIAALKLFGFAISAALQVSLLTLIKRERKLDKLEVLFLSLIACLFVWNFGNFLLLLFPETSSALSQAVFELVVAPLTFGILGFLPSLLLHIHLVFQQKVLPNPILTVSRTLESAIYLPLLFLPIVLIDFIENYPARSLLASSKYAQFFAVWFSFSLLASAFLEWKMLRRSQKSEERVLFAILIAIFLTMTGLVAYTYLFSQASELLDAGGVVETILMLWSVVPSALLGYFIFRHNFLEIAIQRSFGYPFAAVLLLLTYLLSVRYVRDFLETYRIPEEIVQAGMILVLLPMLQPLKRWIDHSIDGLFSRELSRFEKLASSLDDISRSTVDLQQLLRLIQDLLHQELSINSVKIVLNLGPSVPPNIPEHQERYEKITLAKGITPIGEILVEPQSGKLTNEQHAALRFVAPQVVAAIENCRLVEGKIQLERELAERTQMATLGQMAATVAHNIKNPLSSIKTIVQLMQEDKELTEKYEQDLSLINSEVDRLTHSVTQLLKFSKPTILATARVDLAPVLERILLIFRPDAERRSIRFELVLDSNSLPVRGSEEVLSEIFQNLIVNALEVSRENNQIRVHGKIVGPPNQPNVVIEVDDEGPGIPKEIREKIFLPFFTTKQKGTGLGLAVVHRRVMDLSGEVSCISPISVRGGTRFEIKLPLIA